MIVIVVKCRKWFAIFIKYGMKTVFSGNERENSDVFRFPLPCILDPLPHPSVKPQRNQRTLHRLQKSKAFCPSRRRRDAGTFVWNGRRGKTLVQRRLRGNLHVSLRAVCDPSGASHFPGTLFLSSSS